MRSAQVKRSGRSQNYQRGDGGVDIPPALQPYMGGLQAIEPVR